MNQRLPPDAFAYYLGLGVNRSYEVVADRYGVSKTAVVNRAGEEDWPAKLREAERRIAAAAAKKAEESIAAMNDRHLRSLKAIQGKALSALGALSLNNAMDAVRALDLAIKEERVIRGEPSERTAVAIEDVIKREYERWLAPAGNEARDDGLAREAEDAAPPTEAQRLAPPATDASPAEAVDDEDEEESGG